MTKDQILQDLKNVAQALRESHGFDAIIILASKHDEELNVTDNYSPGCGNHTLRIGLAQDLLNKDAAAQFDRPEPNNELDPL